VIDLPVPVVLASSSETRAELLRALLRRFDVVEPLVDERARPGEDPSGRALRLARAKARTVSARRPDALVIGADTIAVCEGEALGKPADRRDAARMLWKLTRVPHSVVTGVCVVAPDARVRSFCVESAVRLRPMTRGQIESYLDRLRPLDKAGAYALAADDPNVESIQGSVSCVMGLPLDELARTLRELYPECDAGR